jgi:TMEM175 potassium channel family protein
MSKGRLEAFSDGVIAIIITIMVLELKAPEHDAELSSLRGTLTPFLGYVLSFVYVGIYWNNHHHMLHAARHVDGRILWANLHLLFWLSLVPFATAWVGRTCCEPTPVALYGTVMLLAGCAYYLLTRALISHHGAESPIAKALGTDFKGKISVGIYAAAIPLAYVSTWISLGLFVAVALMWLVPDRRFERAMAHAHEEHRS